MDSTFYTYSISLHILKYLLLTRLKFNTTKITTEKKC